MATQYLETFLGEYEFPPARSPPFLLSHLPRPLPLSYTLSTVFPLGTAKSSPRTFHARASPRTISRNRTELTGFVLGDRKCKGPTKSRRGRRCGGKLLRHGNLPATIRLRTPSVYSIELIPVRAASHPTHVLFFKPTRVIVSMLILQRAREISLLHRGIIFVK